MKPEIKLKWLAALRSGKFKQGQGILADAIAGTFCCLGVLCELAIKDGVKIDKQTDIPARNMDRSTYDGMAYTLPQSVMDYAALTSDDPTVNHSKLSHHNDADQLTFLQIANLIEKHL